MTNTIKFLYIFQWNIICENETAKLTKGANLKSEYN